MSGSRRYGAADAHSWSRTRVQLGGGLLIGAFLPLAVASVVYAHEITADVFRVSLAAAVLAIAGGYYLFRSLVAFPGIRASYYVLPAFSSSFAIAVVVLFLLRLDYSRPFLVASYLLCVGWYYLVHFRLQKQPDLRIGVVPFGDVDTLHDISSVTWRSIPDPDVSPHEYNAIVADFRADMPDAWESYLADAALGGVRVFHLKQLRESLTGRVEIEHLSENANGSLDPQAAYLTPKFLADLVAAAIALLLLLPVFLVVAVVIKFGSPGPVFFRQQRIGYRGEPFRVWKFRTMTHRAGPVSDARNDAITVSNDVRITKIGRVLRRTRIDELPQLVNVLCGQMSLIGPRPEADVLAHWYEREIPFYRYRHVVRPGITGWAQVNQGHVADVTEVHSKLHYDFYYISNFSLWLDILIVIRTLRTIVTGFGSK